MLPNSCAGGKGDEELGPIEVVVDKPVAVLDVNNKEFVKNTKTEPFLSPEGGAAKMEGLGPPHSYEKGNK